MNTFSMIILSAILVGYVLNLVADILNLRCAGDDPPPEFADIYDPERYRQSQDYLRANTRFGWVVASVDLAALVLFWFAQGFRILDEAVRSLGWGPVPGGLVFIGAILSAKMILSLPFSVYDTFVIEERFGFNKTEWKTFVMDRLKGLFLALVIGAPLLGLILAFFEYAGPDAWWMCWLVFAVFTLIIQFVAPTWIMPLFNTFAPLPDGDLKEAIMAYARRIGYPLASLYVMDGSRRSAKGNAFFTGFGKNRRIALFDTLIRQHTVAELVAVLAHEIGHYKKNHIIKNLIIGILHAGLMFWLMSFFIDSPSLFQAFYVPQTSVYAGLVFFSLLFSPIDLLVGIWIRMMSRKHEFEADHFAVQTTGTPDAMINALKKLVANNLGNLTPHPLYVLLHHSHPPMVSRVQQIRENAAIQGR